MKRFNVFMLIVSCAGGCREGSSPFSADGSSGGAHRPLLEKVADIALPGGATRFDYQSLDPDARRLYFSHMGDGSVIAFDVDKREVIAELPGFPRVTGVLVVPAIHKLYGCASRTHEVVVADTDKLAVTKRMADGKFPDGLAWSPETQKLYVSDESGEVETVIDTRTDERVTAIPMGGEVGNTQYDPTSHLIYACVQTRDELVAIDPTTDQITARYFTPGGKHPHGFLIDDAHNLAYIACQGNNKLLVFNLKTHEIEDRFSVGWVPDVLAMDRSTFTLYVAAELGKVSVFQFDEREGKLRKLGEIDVGSNAHTVAVDPATHLVYFPLKSVKGKPTLRIMRPPA